MLGGFTFFWERAGRGGVTLKGGRGGGGVTLDKFPLSRGR